MDGFMLPLMIAATVGLLAWSASRALVSMRNGSQRKLKKRLSTDGVAAPGPANLSITMQEKATVPEFPATKPYIPRLPRKPSQGFPAMSLQKFLLVIAGLALTPIIFAALFS